MTHDSGPILFTSIHNNHHTSTYYMFMYIQKRNTCIRPNSTEFQWMLLWGFFLGCELSELIMQNKLFCFQKAWLHCVIRLIQVFVKHYYGVCFFPYQFYHYYFIYCVGPNELVKKSSLYIGAIASISSLQTITNTTQKRLEPNSENHNSCSKSNGRGN